MILASAQTNPFRFDVAANIEQHLKFIQKAADHGARLIAFPEMSLTGYERDQASQYAFKTNDIRLDPISQLSGKLNMVVVAGAPVEVEGVLMIGSFVFQPNQPITLYTKQYLHGEESLFFKPSDQFNPILSLEGQLISLAICADIDHPEHAAAACKCGAKFYIPSIFFSPGGIPDAYEQLSGYARLHSMHVLMSNFCVGSWGRPAGGSSAFWDQQGNIKGQLNQEDEGILLVDNSLGDWNSSVIYLK